MELRQIGGIDAPLTVYINHASRFIVPKKRMVQYAQTFPDSEIYERILPQIADLKTEIESGRDLRPRLSRKLDSDGYSSNSRWSDKDFALNAYGVHHLHLQSKNGNGQSEELVFVEIKCTAATMLLAGKHSSFSRPDLENAILAHRASTGEMVLNGLHAPPSSHSGFTAEERKRLARNSFATTEMVNGKVVISANLTNSGGSNLYAKHTQNVLSKLKYFEAQLGDVEFVRALFQKFQMSAPLSPQFSWDYEYTSFFLREDTSGTVFPIVVSPQGLSDSIVNNRDIR
ncbi:hypothetical protein GGR95_003850 [Sulfitobacter undariae]|uniref:Uncharacterized protein n=1 Tax=Sulfitobacter undariae TaxID=1563671 RepID=A0A7W6EBH3_9RHOB|nr:hypothetical protein [Sulfitobacter undariae]